MTNSKRDRARKRPARPKKVNDVTAHAAQRMSAPELLKHCDALTAKLRFYDELADDLMRLVGDVLAVCKNEGIVLAALPTRRAAAERRLNVLRGQLEMFE